MRAAWLVLGMACTTTNPGPAPPATLDTPPSIERGREAYLAYCAICHGEHGDGKGLRHSTLRPPPRDFTNAAWASTQTPATLWKTLEEGRPGTAMPSWRGLDEQTRWDLVSYLRSIGH